MTLSTYHGKKSTPTSLVNDPVLSYELMRQACMTVMVREDSSSTAHMVATAQLAAIDDLLEAYRKGKKEPLRSKYAELQGSMLMITSFDYRSYQDKVVIRNRLKEFNRRKTSFSHVAHGHMAMPVLS